MLVSNHKEFGKRITNLPEIIVCRRFHTEVIYQKDSILSNIRKSLGLLEMVVDGLSFIVYSIETEEFLQGTQHRCLSVTQRTSQEQSPLS